MKTSVVMATYNGASYLREQLDSIREQTCKADEVIFCDDGSKDDTIQILNDYIAENQLGDTWRVVVNDINLGYANNFHKAMQLAQGEYIFFSDQDDIWFPQKIQEMVKILEESHQIQLLCSDYEPFTSAEHAPTVPKKILRKMKNDGSVEPIMLNARNIHIASLGCVMCIRKTFRDRIAPYWISGWAHDDYVWKTAQCVDGCYVYHRPLIKRRLHDKNVSMHKMHQKEIRVKFLSELAEANEAMLSFAKSVGLKKRKVHFIERTVKAAHLRAELVDKCKLVNSFKLICYMDCYHSLKSVLMEPYIALKYKSAR